MLINLLPALSLLWSKGLALLAGFTVSPSFLFQGHTSQELCSFLKLPQLACQGLGKATLSCKSWTSMKEQQQQGCVLGCPVAIIQEPLCTMSLFPVQWTAFKKSQQWDFQNQTCLISFVLVEEVLLLPAWAVGLCIHCMWIWKLSQGPADSSRIDMNCWRDRIWSCKTESHFPLTLHSSVTLDAHFKFWKPCVHYEARIMQLSLFSISISKIDKSLIPQCLGNCL